MENNKKNKLSDHSNTFRSNPRGSIIIIEKLKPTSGS